MANISKITLPDGNTYDLKDRTQTGIFYGTCNTVAATAEKEVECTNFTSTDLKPGVVIIVKFSVTNSAAVTDLKLNVNDTGAKSIKHIRNNSMYNIPGAGYLTNRTYIFYYDGTYWIIVLDYNSNTTYTAGTGLTLSSTTFNLNEFETTSVGSASAGTAISADDITAWTTNTPTEVTKKTVVTSASGATASYANGVLIITDGSFGTGDSVDVIAGTAASLSYTEKTIPNISVTNKTVVTGIEE